MEDDVFYMNMALQQAQAALEIGEVPIGAVVVWEKDGVKTVVGRGHNTRETEKNALHHAEITAINEACNTLHGWRLHLATLYVTTEPCPMCAGAIMNARIKRVVYGCRDPKAGAYGSVFDLNAFPVNHKPQVTGDILAPMCSAILSQFFATVRTGKK